MSETNYKFPPGKWSVEEYRSPKDKNNFTGNFRLQVSGVADNPTHHRAIIVNCDDSEFIAELLAFLNRNNIEPYKIVNS